MHIVVLTVACHSFHFTALCIYAYTTVMCIWKSWEIHSGTLTMHAQCSHKLFPLLNCMCVREREKKVNEPRKRKGSSTTTTTKERENWWGRTRKIKGHIKEPEYDAISKWFCVYRFDWYLRTCTLPLILCKLRNNLLFFWFVLPLLQLYYFQHCRFTSCHGSIWLSWALPCPCDK